MLAVVAAAVLVGGGIGAYELGARHAGHERAQVQQERRAWQRERSELERTNRALRERITLLETSREIDRGAYREVEDSLAELENALQVQAEELQFYRGIVSPEDRVAGLRLERAEIRPDAGRGRFLLRLVVVQALRQVERQEGEIRLILYGSDADGERSIDLAEWPADETHSVDLGFSFRYFQQLEWEFRLPESFVPSRLRVELRPGGRDAVPLDHDMDWPEEGAS
ncbi:MAG: hypothetical protein EA371_14290 [Gammaproteobacteria bacterium]|nr:MAG: hypothetical protein EA371_14290 [Gammaproteobacteria bacterium]